MAKVLVIEDETPVRANIVAMLKAEGFQAIGAENGEVGLQLAQQEIPDLIICDVMMPKLDGFGVLEALHQSLPHQMIPFIFLSAKADKSDFRKGMVSGANDYLTKPFTRGELLAAVTAQLAKRASIMQLQKKITELEQLNVFKDDFLNRVTHDLRNPLTNIMMVAQMLQTAPSPDKQQHYLEILQSECAREQELLNDLLDLQRLEAQVEEPDLAEVLDLEYWILHLAEPFQMRSQNREQTLQVQVSPKLPPILINSSRLMRVLTELLNNACKYTPPSGTITLEVDTNVDASVITFTVRNTAEIPETALPLLFDRFYRVPGGDHWEQGGTGLGLTLVQKLVERLGGNIQVISEAGWTEFIVQLPTQRGK